MTAYQRVKMTLDAIYDAKARAHKAYEDSDSMAYNRIMGDVNALHVCLVGEVQSLVNELSKVKMVYVQGGKR